MGGRRSEVVEFEGLRRVAVFSGQTRRRRRRLFAISALVVITAGAGAWLVVRSIGTADPLPLVQLEIIADEQPVPGAVLSTPDATAVANEQGVASIEGLEAPVLVEVSAPGYLGGTFDVQQLPEDAPLQLVLQPVILRGRVQDSTGAPVADAVVTLNNRTAVTGSTGAFELRGAAPGTMTVERMAWTPAAVEWDGNEEQVFVTMEPFVVRGLRVNGPAAGDRLTELVALADSTTVNTLVFDTKDESGKVMYDSQVALARDAGAIVSFYEPAVAIAAARAKGLYTITRIVTFQDPRAAPVIPAHAIQHVDGGMWTNAAGLGWLDPTDRQAWEYPLALAVEACELGFDEIQFDYVRFPTDGDVSTAVYDVPVDEGVRVDTISAFLTEARTRVRPLGCAVSADIFAIVLQSPNDQGLGQRVEELSYAVDAISPMIYPSHYSDGWLGFDNPNDFPSEVVGAALQSGVPRLEGGAILRPWLQAFSYSPDQVLAGITQAELRELGWILWNAGSVYEREALPGG